MAAIDTTTTLVAGRSFGTRLVHGLVARLTAWNETRVTRMALDKLTDRELDDIGLTRLDVARMG